MLSRFGRLATITGVRMINRSTGLVGLTARRGFATIKEMDERARAASGNPSWGVGVAKTHEELDDGPPAPWEYDATELSYYPRTEVTQLPNGLRVATEERPDSQVSTVGVWIDAGARYESAESNGTAHFLEHMMFKGTQKRSREQLEVGIENMGGHLNAYTSREQTVFYAQCFNKDVPESLDILADILQNSQYTQQAIDRERSTILREYEEVNGVPEEVIFDRLHETAFRGEHGRGSQALGRTILGPVENIKSISRQNIEDYIRQHYTPERMVIAGCGGMKHEELVALADKLFGKMTPAPEPFVTEPATFTGSSLTIRNDDDPLAHIAYAFPTGGWQDPDHFPLMVAQALMGSWQRGMSSGVHSISSLVRAVAQDQLCHQFSTFMTTYSDTGLFGIYGVCENTTCHDFMWHVTQNFIRLSTEEITDERLEAAKNTVKMNALASLESTNSTAEDIGRQFLTYGRRLHPVELTMRIDAIDQAAIKNAADRFFYDHDFALAAIGPIHELPDYNWLRRRTYHLRS